MGWLGLIAVGTFVLAALFYLALGASIVVTSLVETRPVKYLVPAPADDPAWSAMPGTAARATAPPAPGAANPYEAPGASAGYAEAAHQAASAAGFTPHGPYAHAKGGMYQSRNVLWVSPDRRTLAVVTWGTIARIRADKTVLYSSLEDGRYLVTSDNFTGAETPGFYENLVVRGADFGRLLERHEERLRGCGRGVRPVPEGDALAEYEAIIARRFRFLIELGDARPVGGDPTVIRSTLKGALKTYGRTLRPTKNLDRAGPVAKPGEPTATGRPVPEAVVWLERLCVFAMAAAAWLNLRGPATTRAQGVFRLALGAGSLIGLLALYLLKTAFRWRST